MRSIIKIWPVILITFLLLNMPSIKGLTNVQLDRSIEFQIPAIGGLTVIGIDGGIPAAINLPQQGQPFGELINNFNFDIDLKISVEVQFLEANYDANHIRWTNISFNLGEAETLNCGNIKYGEPSSSAGDFFTLAHGGTLEISLDQSSDFIPRGGGSNPTLDYALGVARFYITGYDPDGNEIFYLEPADDFLTQYFVKENATAASTVFNYETYEEINLATIEPVSVEKENASPENSFDLEDKSNELAPGGENEYIEYLPESDGVKKEIDEANDELNSILFMDSILEPLYPAEELNEFNLSGEIEDLQYIPESIRAYEYWYEAVDHKLDTSLHVRFTQPKGKLVGNQVIQILVRRTDNSLNVPELNIDLYQDGVLITALAEQEEIYSVEGTVLTYTFKAIILENLAGANLEIWLFGNDPVEQESGTNAVEFGAITWLAQIE